MSLHVEMLLKIPTIKKQIIAILIILFVHDRGRITIDAFMKRNCLSAPHGSAFSKVSNSNGS